MIRDSKLVLMLMRDPVINRSVLARLGALMMSIIKQKVLTDRSHAMVAVIMISNTVLTRDLRLLVTDCRR